MNREIDQKMKDMLDAHDAVFAGMSRTNNLLGEANKLNGQALDRLGEAVIAIRGASAAMAAVFDANDRTIRAAMQANQAAIDVLALMRRNDETR